MRRPPRVLYTLLSLRELREERARERLNLALAALGEALRDLEDLQKLQKELFSQLTGQELPGRALWLYGQGLEAIFGEKRRAEERWRARQQEVENLRQELEKAHREKRMAERLLERLRRRYQQEEERKFYREMDDLTLMRRGIS